MSAAQGDGAPAWLARLDVFDDAALQALGSKGLLRRARRDLADGRVRLRGLDREGAELEVDGQRVYLDAGGPGAARCSCPDPGICRHRIAATLWARERASSSPGPPPRNGAGEDRAKIPDPRRELARLGQAGIAAWAGKGTMERGLRWLQEHPRPVVRGHGRGLEVQFPGAGPRVYFPAGQGLEGAVCKQPAARRKAWVAAAALAALGLDGGEADAAGAAGAAADQGAVLRQAEDAIVDCARTGLSVAPLVLQERLYALSVEARSSGLGRLGRLLRNLSAGIGEGRAGGVEFDAEAFLGRAAEALALVTALRAPPPTAAGRAGPARTYRALLLGGARQDYQPVGEPPGELELYGLGAHAWSTSGGARGVSAWFYAPDPGRWLQAGPVRGSAHDLGFDPVAAYRGESLWGAGPVQRLSRSRLRLRGAQASPEGRISLAAGVRARIVPWWPAGELGAWPVVFDDWAALQVYCRQHLRSGPGAGSRLLPVVLRPASASKPWFDELGQRLVWPLRDAAGRWLAVIPATAGGTRGAEEEDGAWWRHSPLQGLEVLGVRPPARVTALVRPAGSRFDVQPIAVLAQGRDALLHNLGLDDEPWAAGAGRGGMAHKLGLRLGELAGRRPGLRFHNRQGAVARAVAGGREALVAWAEVGAAALPRIEGEGRRLRALGLDLVADGLDRVCDLDQRSRPRAVLVALYLLGRAADQGRELDWLERE